MTGEPVDGVEVTDACIGSGQCVLLAPDVFALTDAGQSTVIAPGVDPRSVDAVADAIAACPAEAIRWLGDAT